MTAYDIGLADIGLIPNELKRQGHYWRVWWPEEPPPIILKNTESEWFLEESHEIHCNPSWPTYWQFMTHWHNKQRFARNEPTQRFLILNRKPRRHRLAIMLGLQSEELLASNTYSWLEHYPEWFLDSVNQFPITTLDSMDNESDMWTAPEAYDHTAMSLVLESYDDRVFITEKTWIPIHNCRMLLPYGGAGTVAQLLTWGFKFPRFFDFEYDKPADNKVREQLYVQSVKVISDNFKPSHLAKIVKPYAIHNKIVFDNMIRNRTGVPEFKNIPHWANQLNTTMKNFR